MTRQKSSDAALVKEVEGRFSLSRRGFLMAGSGFVLGATVPLGCGGDDNEKSGGGKKAKGTLWAGTEKIVDLAESLHLADIDHFGQFADFGTAARFKYTLGGWMSGWDNDTSMNGMSFTWATKSPSRFYFTVPNQTPLEFVIRVKKGGTDSFSVYLNDNPLTRVRLKSNNWEEHRVKANSETIVVGENYLKFVYRTSDKKVSGITASFAVDYVRVIPEGEDTITGTAFDPPHLSGLRQRYKTDNAEKEGVILCLPTTLSYYAEIPRGASLCFTAAAVIAGGATKTSDATLKLRVTPVDGNKPTDLLSRNYTSGKWREEMVDLSPMAGRFVKMDFIAEGSLGGRLALGEPALRLAPSRIETKGRKARNAVVVLIDTLRADKLTVYSKTRVRTPAFDKFAKESTLFERCQAPSNWTKPSCATVLTGLYPDTHKARGHSSKLASSLKMASEMFLSSGFATGAFIANGYLATEFGFNRGWTKYINFIREKKQTEAEHVFKESLDFIAANKDKPFFTYIQTIDPHVPYDPPSEDLKLYDATEYDGPVQNRSTGNLLEEFKRKRVELNTRDRRRLEALYDGEVTYHDRYFGHFLDGLNKLGVLNDTMIIVCSDHGEEFFDHDSVGHGHTLHQELLHVPLVIRAPGVVPAGKRIKSEVGLGDILPTLLAATNAPLPKRIEGRDLLPICNGGLPDPLCAAFSSFYSEADSRNLSWAVRKGDFKLRMRGPAVTYLYNLASDPRERTDVDTRYPLALRALRIALGQFIAAPDKRNWTSGQIAGQIVGAPKTHDEQAEMPEDLKQQLRALGYIQ
ncbi:MAG: sulfatase [Proteobacteria bacterium]|nr:sulfatase [Pseudomonadota bacterium]